MKIENLRRGDVVLIKANVEYVFPESGFAQVSTKDENFDAYEDELMPEIDDTANPEIGDAIVRLTKMKEDICSKGVPSEDIVALDLAITALKSNACYRTELAVLRRHLYQTIDALDEKITKETADKKITEEA